MLYLDIDGLKWRFKINQFQEDLPGESEYDNWCYMDFAVMRHGVHIYHNYINNPWFTCDEVKDLRDTIASVLDGTITQDKELYFIEDDIEFQFVFDDGKFLYADMVLSYWERGALLTANRLILCLGKYDLERLLCYLQYKTNVNYDKDLFKKYCKEGSIKTEPDKFTCKTIDGQLPPGELPKSVVGIFINDRELLEIVADLENEKLKGGAMDYIYQSASELYGNLVSNNFKERQEEYGVEILSCTCGCIEDGSPTVFITKDEQYVYWIALEHNQIEKINYYFPLNYVFDREQYEQALEELKKFAEDKNIY